MMTVIAWARNRQQPFASRTGYGWFSKTRTTGSPARGQGLGGRDFVTPRFGTSRPNRQPGWIQWARHRHHGGSHAHLSVRHEAPHRGDPPPETGDLSRLAGGKPWSGGGEVPEPFELAVHTQSQAGRGRDFRIADP